jgi:hypothetical protein
MEAEAKEQGSSMAEIGRGMLADLDRWNAVPRERWQDASTIKRFFKKREYRIDPRDVHPAWMVDQPSIALCVQDTRTLQLLDAKFHRQLRDSESIRTLSTLMKAWQASRSCWVAAAAVVSAVSAAGCLERGA